MRIRVLVRTFCLLVLLLWLLPMPVMSHLIAGSSLTFLSQLSSLSQLGMLLWIGLGHFLPYALLVGFVS